MNGRNQNSNNIIEFTKIFNALTIDDSERFVEIMRDFASKYYAGDDVSNHPLTKLYIPIINYGRKAGQLVSKISVAALYMAGEPSGSFSSSSSFSSGLPPDEQDGIFIFQKLRVVTDFYIGKPLEISPNMFTFSTIVFSSVSDVSVIMRNIQIFSGSYTQTLPNYWTVTITAGVLDGIYPFTSGTINIMTTSPLTSGTQTITLLEGELIF
jgi:hypothetical protein